MKGSSLFRLASAANIASTLASITRTYSTIEPALTDIEQSAATALTSHTTSFVPGLVFDRIVHIWLENTDYDKAEQNSDMEWLATKGISLSNHWSLTHPSEPNYAASVSGDLWGNDADNFNRFPSNVSTVVDLLDTRGISWAEYQEHLPYTGYQGFSFANQQTFANDYVRKHNPLIMFDSVVENEQRLSNIKNFTEFYNDLDQNTLPQWMFITPNMTNDGHDSTINVASNWARNFITPLLSNPSFMKRTLILLTFDENETYSVKNKVYSIMFSDAFPQSLLGTYDNTYYTHYSAISSVEANWGLPNLGRHDVNADGEANVYESIAQAYGYQNKIVDTTNQYNNQTPPGGYLNDKYTVLPPVNCSAIGVNGLGVLQSIKNVWCTAECDDELSWGFGFGFEAEVKNATNSSSAASSLAPTTTLAINSSTANYSSNKTNTTSSHANSGSNVFASWSSVFVVTVLAALFV